LLARRIYAVSVIFHVVILTLFKRMSTLNLTDGGLSSAS
jgi:heme O synthase-like polyprenyltransferase